MGARLTNFLTWLFGPPEPAGPADIHFEPGPKISRNYTCGYERAHDPTAREEDLRGIKLDVEREDPTPESLAELAKAATRRDSAGGE